MTPEDRQLLSGLFDRIRAAANTPRDREAETYIAGEIAAQPYAPYLLAQAVVVQDQALKAAEQRIRELQARVAELEQGARQETPSGGGMFARIFGAPAPAPSPVQGSVPAVGGGPSRRAGGFFNAPPPQYNQPQYGQPPFSQPAPGPWAQGNTGGSFLRGAMGTAAGVAGGVLLAEGISSLFSGHHGGLLGNSGFGLAGATPVNETINETIINNYGADSYGADNGWLAGNPQDFQPDPVQDASYDSGYDSGYDDSGDDSYNV